MELELWIAKDEENVALFSARPVWAGDSWAIGKTGTFLGFLSDRTDLALNLECGQAVCLTAIVRSRINDGV